MKIVTYSIHSITQILQESILVLFISSYSLIHLRVTCIDVTSCFVFAEKKKKNDGRGMEFAFVIRLKLFHSEDVSCIFKSSQRISPQFDQLSLSIQYFFVEHFFSVGGADTIICLEIVKGKKQGRAGRIQHFSAPMDADHTNAQHPEDQKHQPGQERCTDSGGEKVCDK